MVSFFKLFLFSLLIIFFGCGSSEGDKIRFAITEAEIHLNTLECNKAITILEEIGAQNSNRRYVQTLASAYACKAGFKETTLFTDLGSVSAGGTLLGQFTKFASALNMTSSDDIDFLNMQTAIDTLLYAGGLSTSNNPTVDSRASMFNADDALNINTQLFYLLFDQLGRYGYYYGCYDGSSGAKGAGRSSAPTCSNECFAHYWSNENISSGGSTVSISAYLAITNPADLAGTCDDRTSGHTSLQGTDYTTSQVTTLCQGVVIMNNFIQVLTEISAKVTAFAAFATVKAFFDTARSNGTATGITDLMDTLSLTKCVADNDNTAGKKNLMKYFVLFYESTFL